MTGSTFIGRESEVAALRTAVANAIAGQGGVVVIEGEPGIGKSALVRAGLAATAERGCRILWSTCDELASRFPLGALLDGLEASEVAEVRQQPDGQATFAGDPIAAYAERCLTLADRMCAISPVVWVLDDLQWADESTLLVWSRLARAVHQLPMLIIGVARPVPYRPEVNRLRRTLLGSAPTRISLGPLPATDVRTLLESLLGRQPGAELSTLAQQAAGNPLYLRELIDSLRYENLVTDTAGRAELIRSASEITVPASLLSIITDRLAFLSKPTTAVLRIAAVLGTEFSATELATATGLSASALLGLLDEVIAAHIIAERGNRLAFRHPLIRQALYSAVPAGWRLAIHSQVAKALADAGVSVERVADQLLADPDALHGWALDWLVEHAPVLSWRSPRVAAQLIDRALGAVDDGDPRRMQLEVAHAKLSLALSRQDPAQESAQWVLAHSSDPDLVGEMTWTLAFSLLRTHDLAEGIATIDAALQNDHLPQVWHARLTAERSLVLAVKHQWDQARSDAMDALTTGERVNDQVAIGYALQTLGLVHAHKCEYAEVVAVTGRALETIGEHPDTLDIRQLLLLARATGLDQLDNMAAAEDDVRAATALADQTGTMRVCTVYSVAAELLYERSRWDDALTLLEAIEDQLPEPHSDHARSASFFYGTRALIAAHRDDRTTMRTDLEAIEILAGGSTEWLVGSLAVTQARAVAFERDNQLDESVVELAGCLDPNSPLSSRPDHDKLLPTLVRLALNAGKPHIAQQATEYAASLARRASPLPRAQAIAQHCQGVFDGDPDLLITAAEYFARTERLLLSGQCFEDAAVILASTDRTTAARHRFAEAVETYLSLGASWDIQRAEHRLRPHGIRRGVRGPRRRPVSGWEALTVTELKVAQLVGLGMSNPDIANELFLSRRTVQTHVSHILTKLHATSRVEIARECARHGGATGVAGDQHARTSSRDVG